MKAKVNQLSAFMITAIMLVLGSGGAYSQTGSDIFGKWKTIDDTSGKPRSIVEIYKQDGKAYGKIIQLFREPGEDPDPICDECSDHRKDQKIIGMEIIEALEQDGEEWEDGEILDPENGKVYRCKIWRKENKLMVRGYIMFLYRTQTWLKVEGT